MTCWRKSTAAPKPQPRAPESSAQEQDAAERVRADLIGQLTAAGVDRSAAELQAQVLSSRYQTRAERRGLGESAWDVYALSGLAIDRETPAVRRLRSQVEQFDTTIDPLIDAVRTGKMPDDRAVFGASLVSALVRAGGLRDTGGDLRSRGALRLRLGWCRRTAWAWTTRLPGRASAGT
jgi:hypothetical protein